MNKMTKEEIKEFDELYQYIKKDIFEYDDSQKFPKYMILRLKGLKEGKFVANTNVTPMANYRYPDILYTFKINKLKIKQIIHSDKFNSEQHRFNTIMMIIEREINDVINRLKRVNENNKKINNMELQNMSHEGAKYKSKNENKLVNEKLNELW